MTHADRPPEAPAPSILAGMLSYLVPGLGHIVQGRTGKGFLFMGILLGMFFLGQAMGDWNNVYLPVLEKPETNPIAKPLTSVWNRWHFAGQFWIGVAAWPAIWQFYEMPMPAKEQNEFWHNFQRAPRDFQDEHRINEYLTNSDKSPDLGWVYTVVAGMLNILVIYDAAMGPAFLAAPRTDDEPGTAGVPAPTPGTEGAAS
jgi:hypothetical protein